jgi:hypothetical protein
VTNLIVIPPSMIIMNLFRRSRQRVTKLALFKKKMVKNMLSGKLLT